MEGRREKQLEEAERLAQLITEHFESGDKVRAIEQKLDTCIEDVEGITDQLARSKAQVQHDREKLVTLQEQVELERTKVTALQQEASTKHYEELPVVLEAMEAVNQVIAQAEEELEVKTATLKQLEKDLRERIEANAEAIRFTKATKAASARMRMKNQQSTTPPSEPKPALRKITEVRQEWSTHPFFSEGLE